jgi:mono/diheme cytochrome c family protein
MELKEFVKSRVFSKLGATFMAMLPMILAFQNCSVLDMKEYDRADLSSSTDPEEQLLDGKALYAQNCASCHGPVESSAKKSRTGTQISIALNGRPEMQAIRLNNTQVELIALALSTLGTNPPPVVTPENRLEFACTPGQMQKTPVVKLTNREYRNALFVLLDSFATTLKTDTTLVSQLDGIPTDIASVDRNTLKEQSLLMTAPISNALFNAAFRSGELVAAATTGLQNYPNTSQCLSATTITQACHQLFVRELGSRAFRRQLGVTEANAVAARFWDNTLSKTDLLKLTFTSIATMPDFLYKIYDQGAPISGSTVLGLTAHEFATKMALFLTGAPADATLKALADNGQIFNDAVINQQADRLLATTGARDMVRRLFRESYGYDVYDRLQYDANFIGGVNTTGLGDVMTNELDNFFVEVVLNRSGSFLDVMTSRFTNATDARLGAIYGVTMGGAATLPIERSGFLNRASMLTKRSGFTASPIKRGLNVIEHVLCQDIGLPPPDAPTSLPTTSEEVITTRMKTARTTESSGTSCASCHSKFNSLGFAFENFDSFGRFRTAETIYSNSVVVGQLPVDSNITTSEVTGSAISTSSPHQFVEKLGISDRAMMCFVKHVKRFEARVPADASANCQMNQSLKTMYGDNVTQGSVVGAIKSLVLSPEFRRWNN